jgi:peptidyl-prolyl cis-trans isomerase B (cyclophilin B)
MKGTLSTLCLLAPLLIGSLAACSGEGEPAKGDTPPPPSESSALAKIGSGPHPVVRLEVGELGALRMELYPEIAPGTVENFLALTSRGFFDGTKFHRVIPGFMIQGGDPSTRKDDPRRYGRGSAGYRIEDEFSDYPHLRGTVAMANRGNPDTASSQFFIVHQDARHLDGAYTAFGRVIEGMEVVDAATAVEIDKFGRYGPPDRPYPVDVLLTKAVVESAPEVAKAEPAGDPGSGPGEGDGT